MKHTGIVFVGVVSALAASLSEGRATNYLYYPNTVLALGNTFDPTDLARSYPACIEYGREISLDRSKKGSDYVGSDDSTNTYGGETNFNINQVQSQQDLYHYLNISASISGHYAFFSGGGSFELEQESKYHEDNFSWIIRATTDYGRFGMENARLTPSAADAQKQGLSAFRLRCGYEYIAQVNRSVMAAAVYTIRNVSSSDKRRLEASFNASVGGGIWGVDAKGSYKEFIKNAASQGVMELKIYLIGGGGVTVISDAAIDSWNIDGVKQKLVSYIKGMDSSRAIPTQYVSGSLSAFVPALANIDFSQYLKTIDELFFLRNEYDSRAKSIRAVLMSSEDYGWDKPKWEEWKTRYDHIQLVLQKIAKVATSCRQAFSVLEIVAATPSDRRTRRADFELISRGLPQRAGAQPEAYLDQLFSPENKELEDARPGPKSVAACSTQNVLLDYDDTKLPPPYPFSADYYVTSTIDATGKNVVNLITYVTGPTVVRIQLLDASDHTMSIFDAAPYGKQQRAGGSIDISDYRTAGKLPIRVRVNVLSGREYEIGIPYI